MNSNEWKALAAVIMADLVGAIGMGIAGTLIGDYPLMKGLRYGLIFGVAVLVLGLLIAVVREVAFQMDRWALGPMEEP